MGSERDVLRAHVAAAVSPRLAALGARLRDAGVRCGIDELITAHQALAQLEPTRALTRIALRCVMCSGRDDLDAFDAAFAQTFVATGPPPGLPDRKPGDVDRSGLERARPGAAATADEVERRRGVDRRELEAPSADDVGGDPLASSAPWSAIELVRDKDFGAYTDRDRLISRPHLRRLGAALPTRLSPRLRAVPGRGERIDARGTIRAAQRVGGDPLELRWLAPSITQRRLAFVCDLSGSMAPYGAAMLEYVHAVTRAGRGVETFCFGTTLARVTHEMRDRNVDRAIARASARLADRSGGTRIGSAIATLNRETGRALGRGAVVVILSDGWDRGETDLLAREMARLRRTSYRVLWLDPHAGSPGYEPLTRGMRAALPHVDQLLAGGSLRALEGLAATLRSALGWATSPALRRRPG